MLFFCWTADLQNLQIGRADDEWQDHNKIVLSSRLIRKQGATDERLVGMQRINLNGGARMVIGYLNGGKPSEFAVEK
jgi:hypothetical protein